MCGARDGEVDLGWDGGLMLSIARKAPTHNHTLSKTQHAPTGQKSTCGKQAKPTNTQSSLLRSAGSGVAQPPAQLASALRLDMAVYETGSSPNTVQLRLDHSLTLVARPGFMHARKLLPSRDRQGAVRIRQTEQYWFQSPTLDLCFPLPPQRLASAIVPPPARPALQYPRQDAWTSRPPQSESPRPAANSSGISRMGENYETKPTHTSTATTSW